MSICHFVNTMYISLYLQNVLDTFLMPYGLKVFVYAWGLKVFFLCPLWVGGSTHDHRAELDGARGLQSKKWAIDFHQKRLFFRLT